jgi:hypothetical protein
VPGTGKSRTFAKPCLRDRTRRATAPAARRGTKALTAAGFEIDPDLWGTEDIEDIENMKNMKDMGDAARRKHACIGCQ